MEQKLIPISALQHTLYCPRQCALIHNEQIWAENQFTAEGQLFHKKSNEGPDEHRSSGSILRRLYVRSEHYHLTGICDVVEYSKEGIFTPVEYKRGKPKSHQADEVQVCAQALCLEEMFQTSITKGLLFYGKTRRRKEVQLDHLLRQLTKSIITQTAKLFSTENTPPAEYQSHLCDNCSLIELCLPHSFRLKRGTNNWFQTQLHQPNSED